MSPHSRSSLHTHSSNDAFSYSYAEKTTALDDRSPLVAQAVKLNVDALALIASLNRSFQNIIGGNRTTAARTSGLGQARCKLTRQYVAGDFDDAFRGLNAISAGFTRVIRDGEESAWKIEAPANWTASSDIDHRIQSIMALPSEAVTKLFQSDSSGLRGLEPSVQTALLRRHNDTLQLTAQQAELARLFTDEQVLIESSSEPNDPLPTAGAGAGAGAVPLTPGGGGGSGGGAAKSPFMEVAVPIETSVFEERNQLRVALVAHARSRNRKFFASMIGILLLIILIIVLATTL